MDKEKTNESKINESKTNELKNIYKDFSLTLLSFDIFILLYPFIAKILGKINPLLVECPYNNATGKLCPFCGGTRMINALWHGTKIEIVSIPVIVILCYVVTNIIFRVIYFCDMKRNERIKKYFLIDVITLSLLIIYLAFVIISFIITNVL